MAIEPEDRLIQPTGRNFVENADVPADPVSLIEDAVEDGELTVKPLMVGKEIIFIEAFKGKGMVDPMHVHDDHESIGYLLRGRLRLVIGDEEFIAEAGDTWLHPRGVPHMSEALEDCVQLEVKSPPRKTWYTDAEILERKKNDK
ncbi:cupin domain-containing protein [Nocardia speluncae]|uniref:Cupin domain-containing protein n=1 Tax=Nocardia speluncae TaxID=419477 RepID=A0A846X8U9_9NOCA|nr:cupin domain-containing protein [Nocardia speluncae]NKY31865.1 cupin domain-containing protein [Nocardia speluncae]